MTGSGHITQARAKGFVPRALVEATDFDCSYQEKRNIRRIPTTHTLQTDKSETADIIFALLKACQKIKLTHNKTETDIPNDTARAPGSIHA